MPTFTVKSTIKRNGQIYKPGDSIEVSKAEAKELGTSLVLDKATEKEVAPRTDAEKKAKKEADRQAKKTREAKEKANEEVTEALNDAGLDDDVDPDLDEPTVVEREVTQEDLDTDPTLVEQGVQVGDVREFPVEETNGDDL